MKKRNLCYIGIIFWLGANLFYTSKLSYASDSPVSQPSTASNGLAELQVTPGFAVSLFARDLAIAKPIQINFDARGRLWLVTSESYPMLDPTQPPQDKIYILEDTDHDGQADRSTIFADGLQIPTGIEIGTNGAYVGNGTELLYLEDTDGDDRADRRHVILSGFGTEDTHHLIHTFRWGPEGMLHFAQSIYIHSHIETPWGTRRLDGGGFWMFDPNQQRLRILVRGMVNSWGIAFDQFGQSFGVDNDTVYSAVKYFLPGARLHYTPGESYFLDGIAKDKPKYCGAAIVDNTVFPEDWHGQFLTCDFRAHRVARFQLQDEGAGFTATELPPLVTSQSLTFRPIDLKFGPDGALYICDWTNPIINHGEVDFRDPRRDKIHGRIWRLVPTNRPLATPLDLQQATIAELISMQAAPDCWVHHFARRQLLDRPKSEVSNALDEAVDHWLEQADRKLLAGLHYLWLRHALGQIDEPLLTALLHAQQGEIRAAATRMLGYCADRLPAQTVIQELTGCVQDPFPRVRLEAIRVLADLQTEANPTFFPDYLADYQRPEITGLALQTLAYPQDRFLDYALTLTCRETAFNWLAAISAAFTQKRAAWPTTLGHSAHWLHALVVLDRPEAVPALAAAWQNGFVPADKRVFVMQKIAQLGQPKDLHLILLEVTKLLTQSDAAGSDPVLLTLLTALQEAQRLRQVRPNGDLVVPVRLLLQSTQPDYQLAGLKFIQFWQLTSLRDELVHWLSKEDLPMVHWEAAVTALGEVGGPQRATNLAQAWQRAWAQPEEPKRLAVVCQIGLQQEPQFILPLCIDAFKQAEHSWTAAREKQLSALFQTILQSQRGPELLVERLASVQLAKPVAECGLRSLQSSPQLFPSLQAALCEAGALPAAAVAPTPAQLQRLVRLTQQRGNAVRGQAIYQQEALACVKCHRIGKEGGLVGPDLTSIGLSAPLDYLIESLLLPQKAIKEGYHAIVVACEDGQVLTGIPIRQTESEWVLRTAENKEISIPTRQIEESAATGSLMPTGLTDKLSEADFLDLSKFLSELGKPGPFGPKSSVECRQWWLTTPLNTTQADLLQKQILSSTTNVQAPAVSWSATSTTNAGGLYLREFALKPELPILFAAVQIRIAVSGTYFLMLEPAASIQSVWLAEKMIQPQTDDKQVEVYQMDLTPGDYRLLLRLDVAGGPDWQNRWLKLTAQSANNALSSHEEAGPIQFLKTCPMQSQTNAN